MKVLVTRPKKQAENLCDLIRKSGGEAIAFPVIEIMPFEQAQSGIVTLQGIDMIIFISQNAVDYFMKGVNEKIPHGTLMISIGEASSRSMRSHHLRVDLQPHTSIGSEGLLLLPELQNMKGKKVLIVRGQGGRELLAETLRQRGADVDYLNVYQRGLPSPSSAQCQQAIKADCLVCTSVVSVKNLMVLLEKDLKSIVDKPMLVLSDRIKVYALSAGFSSVMVTKSTRDEAFIDELNNMDAQ